MKDNNPDRLRDILDAIEKIEKFLGAASKEEFNNDEKTQSSIQHQLTIIGEAANKVSKEIQSENQHIPWSKIISMRNLLIHDYAITDNEEVWNVCKDDLPELKKHIEEIIVKL